MNTTVAVLLGTFAVLCVVEGGHHHRSAESGERGNRPPPMEFPSSVNETVRHEFWTIVKDKNLPPEEKKAKVLEWGQKYGLQQQAMEHEQKIEAWRKMETTMKPEQ